MVFLWFLQGFPTESLGFPSCRGGRQGHRGRGELEADRGGVGLHRGSGESERRQFQMGQPEENHRKMVVFYGVFTVDMQLIYGL